MNNVKYTNDNQVLELVENEGVPYIQFPILAETNMVHHGFSTRLGGVSEGIFSSMNLSFVRGDEDEKVNENFNRISLAIGIEKEHIICSKQTHTNHVIVVGEDLAGNGVTKENILDDIDGLITNIPGLCLATFYADCVPLFFVDPVKKAIGLSHSGWHGTVEKIGEVTLHKMQETYGSNPEDILVAIGPSICQNCYEVSEDVILEFQNNYSRKYWDELFYKKENGKYQLNLWRANEIVLLESGIKRAHIATTNLCTCCNPELLYSHRASKGQRGNLGAFLSIK